MKKESKELMTASVEHFHLPKYEEIPNVGLYLEQVAKYVNEYLAPFDDLTITTSMISNYVKKGLIANPMKKQYYREQIAYIFFIAAAKSVLSLENIRLLFKMQVETYSAQVAYDYFRQEFENVIGYVFELKEELDAVGSNQQTDEKIMLRNTVITVAHRIYLNKCFDVIKKENK